MQVVHIFYRQDMQCWDSSVITKRNDVIITEAVSTHAKFLDSKFLEFLLIFTNCSNKRSLFWLALPKVGFPLVRPDNTVVVMTQDEVMKQKDELICELHQEVEEAECKAEHKVEEAEHKTAELLEN